MEVFVNKAINDGIEAYINKNNGQEYDLVHEFEMSVIEVLAKIYGETDIINPYKIGNDKNLKDNFMVFEAPEICVDNLFSAMDAYERWLQSSSKEKNNVMEEVYRALSYLIAYKNRNAVVSEEEMAFYNDYFALKNPNIKNLVSLTSDRTDNFVDLLHKIVDDIKNIVEKPPVPVLLTESEYLKYGLKIDEVSKLPEEKIKELNAEIKHRNEMALADTQRRNKPKIMVLSSGNGYVDALVLFSIMCTEIMVGVIITVLLARL